MAGSSQSHPDAAVTAKPASTAATRAAHSRFCTP
jgi:hypothetical protein